MGVYSSNAPVRGRVGEEAKTKGGKQPTSFSLGGGGVFPDGNQLPPGNDQHAKRAKASDTSRSDESM